MNDLVLALLLLYFGVYGMIILLVTRAYLARGWDTILSYTPKDLHSTTKMNWFGCIICWIGLFLLNPLNWLVMELPLFIIKYIGKFFYFIFHVGRK